MREKSPIKWLILAALLAVPGLALSQPGDDNRTLVFSGQPGQAPIVRMQGRTYVELEALARLTHGSLTFNGNQTTLTLTLPASATNTVTTVSGEKSEFSKEFLQAGIEEMANVREWRIALTYAVQNGYPVSDDWIAVYRDPALKNLGLAAVAASTDSDRRGYQLLSNEFDNMKQLSAKFVAAHASMNYLPTDALSNDPLDQQILACARSMAAMAASGQFVDDGSCH
jgi:hypothetical protein